MPRSIIAVVLLVTSVVSAQQPQPQRAPPQGVPARLPDNSAKQIPSAERPRDPAAEAMVVREVPQDRPEQRVTDHDRSKIFDPENPAPITNALKDQTKQGRILGFDFARDPLNSDKPFMTFAEIYQKENAARPVATAAQHKLLEKRYNMTARLDPAVTMARGKPLAVGPTARLANGLTWERLSELKPADIKQRG